MEKRLGKMNLQLFADKGSDETQDEDLLVEDDKDGILKDGETGEPTKADLLDLLEDEDYKSQFQAEVDRRITQAIQTRDKKHQEELKKQEQRSKMTAEELQAEKERELSEREQEIKNYEMRLAKVDYFRQNNVPMDLIDYVVVGSEDELEDKTNKLMDVINKQVDEMVSKRLKENGIGIEDDLGESKMTLEELSKLSTDEINKHWESL